MGPAVGNNLRGGSPLPVSGNANILMAVGPAKRIAAEAASARVQLSTTGIRGVSVTAVGDDVRMEVGDDTVVASATSHYLPSGTSRDFQVTPGQYVAAIQVDGAAVLEITELV